MSTDLSDDLRNKATDQAREAAVANAFDTANIVAKVGGRVKEEAFLVLRLALRGQGHRFQALPGAALCLILRLNPAPCCAVPCCAVQAAKVQLGAVLSIVDYNVAPYEPFDLAQPASGSATAAQPASVGQPEQPALLGQLPACRGPSRQQPLRQPA